MFQAHFYHSTIYKTGKASPWQSFLLQPWTISFILPPEKALITGWALLSIGHSRSSTWKTIKKFGWCSQDTVLLVFTRLPESPMGMVTMPQDQAFHVCWFCNQILWVPSWEARAHFLGSDLFQRNNQSNAFWFWEFHEGHFYGYVCMLQKILHAIAVVL